MDDLKINVGIIIGGRSVEREISLISGLQAYFAIDDTKYNKLIIYVDEMSKFYVGSKLHQLDTYKQDKISNIDEIYFTNENNQVYYIYKKRPKKKYPIDIFIPVVHGYNTEDGTISAFLNMYNAIYTSSDLIPSAMVQDKDVTKALLTNRNISNVDYYTLTTNSNLDDLKYKYPVVIKPAYLGSSIGISYVDNKDNLKYSIKEALKYCDKVIVEKALTNYKEFNCAVIKDHNKTIPSAVEEVLHNKDILTFVEKYESEINKLTDAINRIIPAQIENNLYQTIQELSCQIYEEFNLDGVVRIDYLYDTTEKILYVNEINNIPGSLSFYLFEPIGITFKKLLDILIQNAIIKHNLKNKKITHFTSNILNKKSSKLMKK